MDKKRERAPKCRLCGHHHWGIDHKFSDEEKASPVKVRAASSHKRSRLFAAGIKNSTTQGLQERIFHLDSERKEIKAELRKRGNRDRMQKRRSG